MWSFFPMKAGNKFWGRPKKMNKRFFVCLFSPFRYRIKGMRFQIEELVRAKALGLETTYVQGSEDHSYIVHMWPLEHSKEYIGDDGQKDIQSHRLEHSTGDLRTYLLTPSELFL